MEILSPEPGESRCVAICDPDPAPLPPIPLDAKVNIDTRDIDLATFGEFLAGMCAEDVLIPARSASQPVDLKEKETTFGAVLESAGLVVSPPAESRARTRH